MGPAPARKECGMFGLILRTAQRVPAARGKERGSTGWFFQVNRNGTALPSFCVRDCGVCLPHRRQAAIKAADPPRYPPAVAAWSGPCKKVQGVWQGLGGRCESLADTVARRPFRQSSVLSAVSQETWLVIPNFKETEMGVLQRCEKTHSPGLATAERAEAMVDSSGQLIWTPRPRGGHRSYAR